MSRQWSGLQALPVAIARQVSVKGELLGGGEVTFAIPPHVGPRKDALDCLPRGVGEAWA